MAISKLFPMIEASKKHEYDHWLPDLFLFVSPSIILGCFKVHSDSLKSQCVDFKNQKKEKGRGQI